MKTKPEITMIISEDEWRRPPTRSEVKEAEKTLNDFCVHLEMPEFTTYRDMQRWMQAKIRAALIKAWEGGCA